MTQKLLLSNAADFSVGETDELVPEAQFCATHDITNRCARKWRETGDGPEYVRVGRSVFYPRRAIAEWLVTRTFRHRAAEAVARHAA
jgi:hypothetical protein